MAIFGKTKSNKEEVVKEEKVEIKESGSRTHANYKPSFLIKQAWITEKAARGNADRQYSFIVSGKTNKSEIRKAIESLYGVKVQVVNMINVKGKSKRLGRSMGRTSDYKKAIITLKEGEKIEALTT